MLMWDISLGEQYDLRVRANQRLILGWLKAGQVRGVHMGTPCQSFSRARDHGPGPPPLRSDAWPMGLPTLARTGDQEAVRVGNMLMAFSAAVFHLCIRLAVPVTIENPARSRLWICPPTMALLRRKATAFTLTEFCMWGKPWRKSTAFLSAHIAPDVLGSRRCLGAKRGCCKRTGNPHIVLSGLAPCGAFWTKVAEPFPASLCSCLADAFSNAFTAVQAKRFSRFLCGVP